MSFSVIIPTFNRTELLGNCLKLLEKSIDKSCEVIVSDDSSTMDTKQLISSNYPWVKWVKGPKKGPAANRNNGAKFSIGKWLIFIDDDCLPGEKIIQHYQSALVDNPQLEVFEGSIFVDREKRNFLEESPVNTSGNRLWSCNFMISKELFTEDLQGFDENFPFAAIEDVDLHYRITKLNKQILFVRSASVVHPWRLQKNLVSITFKRFHSTLYFLQKHPEKRSQINSRYYFTAFYYGFFKDTLKNFLRYRGRGFFQKVGYDFLQISFGLQLLRSSSLKK